MRTYQSRSVPMYIKRPCSVSKRPTFGDFAIKTGVAMLLGLVLLMLPSCGPTVKELAADAGKTGKAIIITPKTDNSVFWRGKTPLVYYGSLAPNSASSGKYQVAELEPGQYSMAAVVYTVPARADNAPSEAQTTFRSNLGTAKLFKTPDKKVVVDKYNLEAVVNIDDIPSYYQTRYDLKDSGQTGSLTVGYDEVVLAPAIRAEVGLGSCDVVNKAKVATQQVFLDDYGRGYERFNKNANDNELDTWEWACPVEYLRFYITKPSIEDLRARAANSNFSPELLNKVTVREFVPGEMFTKPHDISVGADGTEVHTFWGKNKR